MEKNRYNIDKSIHYFCLMQPIQSFFNISFTCSSDAFEWFECEIDESRYQVDDNYKITLRALDGRAYEHYYQSDFMSLIKGGQVIPKTSDKMHIEEINFIEPIPGTIAYLKHEGSCIVEG